MKIWNVNSGPYENDDGQIWNVCLIENEEGQMVEDEIYYETFDDAYSMVVHFKFKIEPIEIEEFYDPNTPRYS